MKDCDTKKFLGVCLNNHVNIHDRNCVEFESLNYMFPVHRRPPTVRDCRNAIKFKF